jgi:predicted Zn-dependent protease
MVQTSARLALAAAALLAVPACPKSETGPGPQPPIGDGNGDGDASTRALPPAIPAEIKLQTVAPNDGHSPQARSPLLDHMVKENKRWFASLSRRPAAADRSRPRARIPAYFIGYRIIDERTVVIDATDGGIITNEDMDDRSVDVEVRVGSPELDNLRTLKDRQLDALTSLQRVGVMPRGTDREAIQHHLWLETDRRYREAATRYALVVNDQQTQGSQTDHPPDFSREKAEVFIGKPAKLSIDKKEWLRRIRGCSSRGQKASNKATRTSCRVQFSETMTYYVNSEGSQIQRARTDARLIVSVGVKAPDGQSLSRLEQVFATGPDQLPSDAEIDKLLALVNKDLNDLHDSPVVDPYVGPAILEGRAAAVFFHEVFGHRVEGHRQKDELSGQTFSAKVGRRIMPEWLTVYDDPTVAALNGTTLNGFYRFDDEGVRAQRAALVTDGVLKGFVQGRDPLKNFPRSNGHGRKEPGLNAVSRQGNLLVETRRSVTKDELRAELIAEVKRQNKDYGMLFTDITGGFTNTSRLGSQSFEVTPVMAYRIYKDGREELVRGVDIVGTPLTALGSIISAARPLETFNGMCGAESGWVPVSASSPSLLLSSLEVERSFSPNDSGPTLDPPSLRSLPGGAR